MSLATSLRTATSATQRFTQSLSQSSGSVSKMRTSTNQGTTAFKNMGSGATRLGTAVGKLRGSVSQMDGPLGKSKTTTDRLQGSLGKLQSSVTKNASGIGKFKTSLGQTDGALGKSKSASDKFKTSLDKLKSSADKAKTALRGVKGQADAVEKSVGKAGKNADKTGKSMGGGLAKGLKGAGLAQKGLNLAMMASPFGLIMALLAPLIAKFVNVDKIVAVVSRGFKSGMKAASSAVSTAIGVMGPILKGIGNVLLAPFRAFATAVNTIIGALNGFKVSIPGWVPVFGGKSFSISLPKIPIPHLAKGGVVQPRNGGTLAVLGEAGESEAVIPLSRLERMLGSGAGNRAQMARLTAAVERLAERPVHVQVDGQTIARAVLSGHRQLARR
ncbi:hypothetical protein [Streptomyces sp. H27-C3]|uniref:hypothetical protein n=1 Tax=Streptomyces sp. H27-C3 TaxID=3046305 RepID=UPI0024B960E2|nr:hypothetical protein [Streptomyces sp. H27-C3]MDJ0465190.1 hypothetical protein [Streptomyces sp. H27-C3]